MTPILLPLEKKLVPTPPNHIFSTPSLSVPETHELAFLLREAARKWVFVGQNRGSRPPLGVSDPMVRLANVLPIKNKWAALLRVQGWLIRPNVYMARLWWHI